MQPARGHPRPLDHSLNHSSQPGPPIVKRAACHTNVLNKGGLNLASSATGRKSQQGVRSA